MMALEEDIMLNIMQDLEQGRFLLFFQLAALIHHQQDVHGHMMELVRQNIVVVLLDI